MRGRGVLAGLLLLLTACSNPVTTPRPDTLPEDSPAPTDTVASADLEATDVATDLDTVWALAFAPDGSLHFTERGGRLTTMTLAEGGTLLYHRGETIEIDGVVESGEAGLMGLAIDSRGRRFVMYTAERENRIVRVAADGSQSVLVDGIPAGAVHDGGRLAFGPDGMLYASTGDAGNQSSVRRGGLSGRILQVDPDSGEHEVFSTGHRNPQGLCFASDGKLFSTEHGPDRGDEVNILERGRDYGWPQTTGTGLVNYTPTIAPSGCAVYESDTIAQWKGDLLFGTLKDQSLRRLDLGEEVVGQEQLYAGQFGRIRDVVVGPEGAVYLATSNRDGRGDPRPGDDRIVRLAPPAPDGPQGPDL